MDHHPVRRCQMVCRTSEFHRPLRCNLCSSLLCLKVINNNSSNSSISSSRLSSMRNRLFLVSCLSNRLHRRSSRFTNSRPSNSNSGNYRETIRKCKSNISSHKWWSSSHNISSKLCNSSHNISNNQCSSSSSSSISSSQPHLSSRKSMFQVRRDMTFVSEPSKSNLNWSQLSKTSKCGKMIKLVM